MHAKVKSGLFHLSVLGLIGKYTYLSMLTLLYCFMFSVDLVCFLRLEMFHEFITNFLPILAIITKQV